MARRSEIAAQSDPCSPPLIKLKFCFAKDTPVCTPLGTKAIEEVQPGELVTVFAMESGDFEDVPVERLERHNAEVALHGIRLMDGSRIRVTEGHPFLTSRGWIYSHEITRGTMIQSRIGFLAVREITREATDLREIFNVRTKVGTFLVGRAGLIVHCDTAADRARRRVR